MTTSGDVGTEIAPEVADDPSSPLAWTISSTAPAASREP
jgi:hypothetical protein